MRNWFYYQFFANGRAALPGEIVYGEGCYKLREVMKYDFFAGTGLYELAGEGDGPKKLVLKMGRQKHFLGLPLSLLGRAMVGHEVSILKHLGDVEGVAKVLYRYGRCGFVYEFIEGQTLLERDEAGEEFFADLRDLIDEVHARNVAYVDMNKRDNIICGDDGKPYLIDFQISVHFKGRFAILRYIGGVIKSELFKADLYHLYKHKRRMCPGSLLSDEAAFARPNKFIRAHRFLTIPYRKVRGVLLRWLENPRIKSGG